MRTLIFFLILWLPLFSNAQTAESLYKDAETAVDKGNFDAAYKSVTKAIEKDSMVAKYHVLHGALLIRKEKIDEGMAAYATAIRVEPKNYEPLSERALLFETSGLTDQAIRDYSAALELVKEDTLVAMILANRSAAKMQARDFKGAYNDLTKAYQMDSSSIAVLNNLAHVCDEFGKYDEAIYYLEKLLTIDPEPFTTYTNLGFTYQSRGNYEKSLGYFDKAIEIKKDEPYALNNRSYSKLKLGDLKGAMADVNLSISLSPENSYAYRNRALIYIAMGKQDKGCEDINTAIKKGFTQYYGNSIMELLNENCK